MKIKLSGIAITVMLCIAILVACGGGGTTTAAKKYPRFAYVANEGDNSVSTYALDATGRLKLVGTVAAGTNPISVTTVGSYQ